MNSKLLNFMIYMITIFILKYDVIPVLQERKFKKRKKEKKNLFQVLGGNRKE